MSDGIETVDIIVVGGGLAGLACAHEAARSGLNVLLVERGDHPGSKNVSGGRLYADPVRDMLPADFWTTAPLERPVARESLTLMSAGSSVTATFTGDDLRTPRPASYTVLRSKLDRWFGAQVEQAGGVVVPQSEATSLMRRDGHVVGVKAGDEELAAHVVVLAEGALGMLAREAGLAPPLDPARLALGIKQVVALPSGRIEDRFQLMPGEGEARLFVGALTQGIHGGGFLYTNRDSVSIGIMLALDGVGGRKPGAEGTDAILEAFLQRSEIRPLLEGGELVEYSAHLVPERAPGGAPAKRVADGVLVAGDAAGLVVNHGFTVRGMDFAIASGVLAARACVHAKARGDFSSTTLAEYDRLLEASFVLRDLARHAGAAAFLRKDRLYSLYPDAVCAIAQDLYRVGTDGKDPVWPALWGRLRSSFLDWQGFKDVFEMRKL